MDELRFDGRSVIVTGGGRGFGRQHALLLASRGARVVVADYGVEIDGSGSSPEPAESVVQEIRDAGGEAVPCVENVAEEAGAARIVQTAVDTFGGVDVLVNNAGIWAGDWFENISNEQLRRMTDYHYLGTAYTCAAAWPYLKAADHGAIVNTSSEAVLGIIPKNADYAGPKGAVYSFTKALALDGRRYGLRVNAIAPRGNTRLSSPEVLSVTFDRPLEQPSGPKHDALDPANVSPAVAVLAHESCTLNGEVLVCGGQMAMRMALIETKGVTFPEGITPERLFEQLDAVMDPTDANVVSIDLWVTS
jgi:NAD(P)-dependent dehydrogenase (short-subunit alcohol dehydrogenase family)